MTARTFLTSLILALMASVTLAFVPSLASHILRFASPYTSRRETIRYAVETKTKARKTGYVTKDEIGLLWKRHNDLQQARLLDEVAFRKNVSKAARSMVHYVQKNKCRPHMLNNPGFTYVFETASIQTIRVASSIDEPIMILKFLKSARHFLNGLSLSNRILGEAIRNLRICSSASLDHVQQVWALMDKSNLTAMEVNTMLAALSHFNRTDAVQQLFWEQLETKTVDECSISTTIHSLTKSVSENQQPSIEVPDIDNQILNQILASPCWQWKEAIKVLDKSSTLIKFNNHIFSALIKLDIRAAEVFWREHHSHALTSLEVMRYFGVNPDEVTCMNILGSHNSWRVLLDFFRLMQQSSDPPSEQGRISVKLPRPNIYCYSAIMATCARAAQRAMVLQLLDELERDSYVEPNRYAYNAVLLSLVRGPKRQSLDRVLTALKLVQIMQDSNIMPCRVTFSTLFALLCEVTLQPSDWEQIEQLHGLSTYESLVKWLLDLMIQLDVPRETKTLSRAITASGHSGSASVNRMLERAMEDIENQAKSTTEETELLNAAIKAMMKGGFYEAAARCISQIAASREIGPIEEAVALLIECLRYGGKSNWIPSLALALDGNTTAIAYLKENSLDLPYEKLPPISKKTFTRAIIACLHVRDFNSSRLLLRQMKRKNMQLSPVVLKYFAIAFAMESMERSREAADASPSSSTSVTEAQKYALKAATIMDKLEVISARACTLVCCACVNATLFFKARQGLRRMHQSLLSSYGLSSTFSSVPSVSGVVLADKRNSEDCALPETHLQLLESCMRHGNITATLQFVRDIQGLQWMLLNALRQERAEPSLIQTDYRFSRLRYGQISRLSIPWNLWHDLVAAAAKQLDWNSCISVMHLLKPELERLRPSRLRRKDIPLDIRIYKPAAKVLSNTVKCLVAVGQNELAIETIRNWVQWSGLRPPVAPVAKVIRVLSADYREEDVVQLVVTSLLASSGQHADRAREELILYVSAIAALSNDGMFRAADKLFLAATANGSLPFKVDDVSIEGMKCITLDLHQMNKATARCAVRVLLQQRMIELANGKNVEKKDLILITGRGLHSKQRLRPVLRPEIQDFLIEEFYPPLNSWSLPGNMGAIRVPHEDIQAWADAQRRTRNAFILEGAATLKKLAGMDRLRDVIALKKMKGYDEDMQHSVDINQ